MKEEWYSKAGSQTLCAVLLTIGVYSGIDICNIGGGIGTSLFVGAMTFCLEIGVYNVTGFKLDKVHRIAVLMFSIFYLLISIFIPQAALSRVGLAVMSIGLVFIYLSAIVHWKNELLEKTVAAIYMIAFLSSLLYLWENIGWFSVDSYSYYEIAKTFQGEFGLVNTIRQYVVQTDYNVSFPYFYPLCIWVVNCITGLGRYSGVIFNFYCMLFTGLLFLHISKIFVKRLWCGGLAASILFINIYYMAEVSAARAIPLSIMMTTLSFCLCAEGYLKSKVSWEMLFGVGICAGVVMTTRFDGLLLAVYCAGLVVLMQKEKRFKNFFLYASGVLIIIFPWMWYSICHFQSVWISDNMGTMFLVETITPRRVSTPDEWIATLFNSPGIWFAALLQKTKQIVISILRCSPCADLLAVSFCGIYACVRKKLKLINLKTWVVMAAMLLFYIGKTCMYILVGYNDNRYHVETIVLLVFMGLMLYEKIDSGRGKTISLCIAVSVFVGLAINKEYISNKLLLEPYAYPLQVIEVAPKWVSTLNEELEQHINDKEEEIFFLGNDVDEFVFGGWTDWKIYTKPSVVSLEKILYMMDAYMDVEYVIIAKETTLPVEIDEWLEFSYESVELEDFLLYSVKNE